MSSKKAMRQAQKQAYAKHRSNISNSRFDLKKKFLTKNKDVKKKFNFVDQIFLLFYKLTFLKYPQYHLKLI